MPKYRLELDDGTGTFVVCTVEADNETAAEEIAIEQVKARPGANPELVVIVTVNLE